MIPERPDYLTYRQVGELLGVSDRTIWAMVKRGELPAARFAGRTVRIDRRDIEALMERGKRRAVTP